MLSRIISADAQKGTKPDHRVGCAGILVLFPFTVPLFKYCVVMSRIEFTVRCMLHAAWLRYYLDKKNMSGLLMEMCQLRDLFITFVMRNNEITTSEQPGIAEGLRGETVEERWVESTQRIRESEQQRIEIRELDN